MKRLLLLIVFSIVIAACGGGGSDSCLIYCGSGTSSPIDVTTTSATGITAHSATLNAIINPNGIGNVYWFKWSSAPGLLGELGTLNQYISTGTDNGNGDVSVSAPISSLASNTTYYYQAWAGTNSILYDSAGTIKQFTTPYEYARYWIRSYGGQEDEFASAIINTTDGGYLLAGRTNTFIADPLNGGNMWIVKLTDEGAISWQKSIGGAGSDIAYSVVQTNDGNYLIAGMTEINYVPGSTQHQRQPWLVKLNQQGSILWQKTYSEGTIKTLIEASDGSLLLSGRHMNTLTGNPDYWLVSLDSYGNILWQYAFDTSQDDLLDAAASTANGVVLAGTSASNLWLLEVSLSGAIVWQGYYNCNITPYSVATLASSGFVITDTRSSLATRIMKIDAGGTIDWVNDYSLGYSRSVIETSSGGIVAAGCVGDTTNCYTAAIKLAPDGSVIWQKKYNLYKPYASASYLANGMAYSIGENSSGDLYLAATFNMGYQDNDTQVLVLPPDGTLAPIDSDVSVTPQAVTCSVASSPSVNIVTTTAVANPAAIGSTQVSYARVLQQAPQ